MGLLEHTKEYPIDKFLDADKNRQLVLLSIKFPNKMMDEKADELKLEANLCLSFTNIYVKGEFSKQYRDNFTCFDADERQEIILEIFEQ